MKRSTSDLLTYYGQDDEIVLPIGYVRLEYLETDTTNKQYIDTGILSTSNTGYLLDIKGFNSSTDTWVYGSYVNNIRNALNFDWNSNYLYIGWVSSILTVHMDENRHLYSVNYMNNKSAYRDGVFLKSFSGNADTGLTAYLGARNNDGTIEPYSATRIYSLTITDGTQIVQRLIPALRLSDMKPGMYDLVTDAFLVNQGTKADFIYSLIPNAYRRVQYITGQTGKLDTGILSNNDDELSIESCFKFNGFNQYSGIYGYYVNEGSNTTRLIMGANNTSLLFYLNTKAGGGGTGVAGSSVGVWNTAYHDRSKVILNGTTVSITNNTKGNASSGTIKLWAAGTTSNVTAFKYFSIYDKGTPALCLIPVVRVSDSQPGFYDTVSKEFLTTTDLTATEIE